MATWTESLGAIVAGATALDWAILTLSVILLVHWLGTRTHDHFKRRGMPFLQPIPFVGNMGSVSLGRVSLNDFAVDMYRKHEGLHAFGFFQFMRPTLYLRDPELIKIVTVKNFDNFVDHLVVTSQNIEPIFTRNLFSLNSQEWRDMRATLSPAFTTSKMRHIFKLIDMCGEQMVNYLDRKIKTVPGCMIETEMKALFTRFANDVIATSAFGVECDSLAQPDNKFYRMGCELTTVGGIKALIFLGYLFSPRLMKLLRIKFHSEEVRDFFHNTVHDTIQERQTKGIFRPDMLQLLMQAREGKLKTEAGDEQERIKGARVMCLTDMDITAQAVIFFFAGFDTMSSVLSFCAYALARHPDMQTRVQQEIDTACERNGGKLTYEAMQQLKYFDMFISEVLRLYGSVPTMDRKCTKDFTIPAQDNVPAYTVRKGDIIWIPVFPIHRDPQYWDDPNKFDPERFSEKNKHKIKPFTYMPFGVGPRNCIGSRFALLETKVALSHILRRFTLQSTERTPATVEFAGGDFRSSIKGGFWIAVTPRAE